MFGSVIEVNESSVKKLPGENAIRSEESDDREHKGR
jgi:hypothetical protein